MSHLREYIEKHPSATQRLLGIDYDQLIEVITNAEHLYARHKIPQENQKIRIIKPGSGRPPKLRIADQILLTLVYLHHLPTFQILGVQFDLGESTANYIFHRWVKILDLRRYTICSVDTTTVASRLTSQSERLLLSDRL